MENKPKNFKHELIKICWYMRGGVTYSEESAALSPQEREIIGKLVKDNLGNYQKNRSTFLLNHIVYYNGI